MIPLGGWKTKIGAALLVVGAGLKALGMVELGEAVHQVGIAIMGLGIAHKVAKIR